MSEDKELASKLEAEASPQDKELVTKPEAGPQEGEVAEQAKVEGLIRGTVTHPWGPVKGARVVIGEKSAVSDGTGKYEISALAVGSYSVSVEAPFPGYEASPQKVDLAAGETKVVDIYLDFEKAVVEGYVYALDGHPIAGATLSGVLSGKDMETATTDAQGHFRFEHVTPGERFMRANAKGYMGDTRDFVVSKKGATTIEFRLSPATCKIEGIVSNESGQPMQAEVLLSKSGIVCQKTKSDAKTGFYEFPLLPGTYEVLATAPYYMAKGWRGDVSTDIKVDLRLTAIPETTEQSQQL